MRLDSLTGLRWWAAFAVFCYHMMNFAPVPGLGAVARYGNHGVAFFFVLSGFVLTWSARISGTTVANFYWRRFARIYPAHVVALLVAIPVFYSVTSATPDPSRFWVKPFAVAPLLLSLVLLQSWFKDPSIRFSGNPAAWTLGVEAFFYALHPWLSRLLARVSRRGALLALGAVTAVVMLHRVAVVRDPSGVLAGLPSPWPVLRSSSWAWWWPASSSSVPAGGSAPGWGMPPWPPSSPGPCSSVATGGRVPGPSGPRTWSCRFSRSSLR